MAGFSGWFGPNWWNNALNTTNFQSNFNKFSLPTATGNGFSGWGSLKGLAPTIGTATYSNGMLRSGVNNVMRAMNDSSNGSGWISKLFGNSGVIPGISAGLQALGGLADVWLGGRNLALAQDALDIQTALANRNLSNQAKVINNVYDVAGRVGAALSNQNWDGTIDKNALAASEEQAKRQHVDGSYIG